MKASLQARFDAKVLRVPFCDCWLWVGATQTNGYGQIYDGARVQLAHRVSYEMHKGNIGEADCVLHECDNPACVNPDHLWLGNQDANMKDMAKKGRSNRRWKIRGTDVVFSKLCATDVIEIRTKYASGGASQRKLAADYGVTQPAIGAVIRREVWKHI